MDTQTSLERLIVSAIIKDRNAFNTFELVGERGILSPIGGLCYKAAKEYYDGDSSSGSVGMDFIRHRLGRDVQNPKHEGPIRDYLDGLDPNVSAVSIAAELRALHRLRVGGKLSLALANGAPLDEVRGLITEFQKAEYEGAEEEVRDRLVNVFDVNDMLSEKANVEFIKLWPKPLNDRLDGGALRGHHVFVFARPEMGKTAFSINLATGFVHQRLNVLYVGNEEPSADIRDRFRGRILKVSKSDIRRDTGDLAARLAAAEENLGRFVIAPDSTSFMATEKVLEAADINTGLFDVVVFDQLRNMRVRSESRTTELEAAGIAARHIAKRYGVLVVSISQAGNSADGKVFLGMSDVDSSKTGLPASADLMIGLGADDAMTANGLLGISLCKNKLSGLHDQFTVSVNYATGVLS